jgi:bifunctional DNA-binding transcriptional regulator/antitoxin component of YhaV-PrlF toxin-antitoxin module
VIPAALRRKHEIEAGIKVKILEDQFGRIVLQPITEDYIDGVTGCLVGRRICWRTGKRNIVRKVNTIDENVLVRCECAVRLSPEDSRRDEGQRMLKQPYAGPCGC